MYDVYLLPGIYPGRLHMWRDVNQPGYKATVLIHMHCCPQNYFKKIWNFVEFLSTSGAILEFILQQTVISDNSDVRIYMFVDLTCTCMYILYMQYIILVRCMYICICTYVLGNTCA